MRFKPGTIEKIYITAFFCVLAFVFYLIADALGVFDAIGSAFESIFE